MRKLLLATAAVAAAICLAGCSKKVVQQHIPETQDTLPVITYDTLTDTRDGQTYKTVVIGGQMWMAQNLNYKIPDSSWCYENSADTCNKYGRLYTWGAAMTACPYGWTLPDSVMWRILETTAGGKIAGKNLKARNGWIPWLLTHSTVHRSYGNSNGTDRYGFSALPSGVRLPDGKFKYIGEHTGYWAYSNGPQSWEVFDFYHFLYYDFYGTESGNVHPPVNGIGFSVRCVADSP